jgi:signal transduction histidine kinase/ligand-binding sensor domain-containing protein
LSRSIRKRLVYRSVASLACLLVLLSPASAERLPVKTYTTDDGLPVDIVIRIKRDSHGFLWFCTRDGLSKFDGYQFTNYGKEQGLPYPQVNDLIESSDGTYWAATNGGGVCSFNPAERAANSASRFKTYSLDPNPTSNIVNRLCEDREGRIWAGTDQGLFYFDKAQGRFIVVIPDARDIYSLLADGQGALWMGVSNQLWRRSPDGRLAHYSFQVGGNLGRIYSLLTDDKGKLWAGSWYQGLFELDPKFLPLADCALQVGKTPGLLNQYTIANGAVIGTVVGLHQSADGHLWIVATQDHITSLGGGLFEFDGERFRRYGKAQGLTNDYLQCLADDSEGNFWLGGTGAMKIARNGFTTFGESDGLVGPASSIFENRAGELCLITEKGMVINRFIDGRFISTRLNVPKSLENSGLWGTYQMTFQDHDGDWWVPTYKGLMRFASVARIEQLARARPKAHYLLGSDRDQFDIIRMFEDSRGDIWVSLAGPYAKNGLVKWERATEKFRFYTADDGVPLFSPPAAFCEDAHENLWIGLYGGGLLRYRAGRFDMFDAADGLPSGVIINLHLDRSHRLWIASTSDGAARMEDPGAERPSFVRYTIADGLSSNVVFSITEDDWGRIYFRTVRSIDCLNPVTRNIRRYTAADGLRPGGSGFGFRDRHGALWFNEFYEVTRLVPGPDEQQPPPPIFITGLRVTGDAQPIADLGENDIRGLKLAPSQNHIQIDFVGLAFGAGEALQYQYKLDGADRDWQPLNSLRTVNYASLAPGAYRFVVRAMNAEGLFSQSPATVEFRVLAPFWQQWWFIAITALAVGTAVYAAYRYRVSQLVELERVRTRIAADLHDDIGANLTRIAILSEVAHSQLRHDKASIETPLSSIAQISRESVASMGDIVWAINPKRDHLIDLVQRMRRLASEVFVGRKIEFEFRAPESEDGLTLGADVRRDVFLIFKEAVNNAARHSNCSRVDIELLVERSSILLIVRDDGRGFDIEVSTEGNGLVSMKKRAASLGGELELRSTQGKGSEITLRVPRR